MPMYMCVECGKSHMVGDEEAKWSAFVRCECGAKARDLSRISAGGNHWKLTGGWGGSDGAKGSLSRALPTDMVADQIKKDRSNGTSGCVREWRKDPNNPSISRPVFNSPQSRKNWDRGNDRKFYDADSYI